MKPSGEPQRGEAHQIKATSAFEGGPGIRHGMLLHARRHGMLRC
jgi:hypothetical protein